MKLKDLPEYKQRCYQFRLKKYILAAQDTLHGAVDGMYEVRLNCSFNTWNKQADPDIPRYAVAIVGCDDYVFASPGTYDLSQAIELYNTVDHGFPVWDIEKWKFT